MQAVSGYRETKKEQKRRKEEARQRARAAERRRSVITSLIVFGVLVVGAVLVFVSVREESVAEAEQQRQAEELRSELEAQASEEAERLANREVACGAEAPPAAGEEKPTFDEPAQVLDEGTDYRAVIETSCGTVEIDLAEERAPETVNSFVFLAQQGFFDGLEIFRNATTIGALQTGAGTNEAAHQIGYTLPDELDFAQSEGYPPGSVAMANAGPDTAGSQFFFVYNSSFDESFVDNRAYTRFATVTEGLDVLQEIGAIEAIGPQGESPSELVYIESVSIETGGGSAAAPAASPAATSTPTPAETSGN